MHLEIRFLSQSGYHPQTMEIAIIGNAAGGKSRLARQLATRYRLTTIHIDTLQFEPPMKIRAAAETRALITHATPPTDWIIDGHGPLELLIPRLEAASHIVFIDFSLRRHRWWFLKRQLASLLQPRTELPPGCSETTWAHTKKVWQSMRSMHRQMRPELHRLLTQPHLKAKTHLVQTLDQWQKLYDQGF